MSIKLKFFLTFFMVIPIVFLLFIGYEVYYIYNKNVKALVYEQNLILQFQANSLGVPLKNSDDAAIKKVLEFFSKDPDFVHAEIFDKTNKKIYEFPPHPQDYKNEVVLQAPLMHENESLGNLSVTFSLAYLDGQLQKIMWIGLIQFIVLIGLVYLIISKNLKKFIFNPLDNLVSVTHQLSSGDLSARTNIKTKDEMERIGTAFNQMAASIQDYSAGLEQKVRERTKELQESLETVQKMQKHMVVQEKLASLGSLTAGIAHEIKNPLNFINNLALLSVKSAAKLSEVFADEKAHVTEQSATIFEKNLKNLNDNVTKISEYGKRADGIVTSMLEHSRGKSGTFQIKELHPIIDEAIKLAYHGVTAKNPTLNATIQLNFSPAVKEIELIPQDISRVFLNLANNAFYALNMRKKTAGAEYVPTLTITTQDAGEKVSISIRDNGIGMSPETINSLFSPFFTTKPAGEGTGLGLSISHDIIVETHAGSIEATSQPNVCTEFVIMLPKKKK